MTMTRVDENAVRRDQRALDREKENEERRQWMAAQMDRTDPLPGQACGNAAGPLHRATQEVERDNAIFRSGEPG